MSRRSLVAATAALVLGALAVASATAAAPPTRTPGRIVFALSLPSPGLQVGAVQGSAVVFAKGLEVELARAIAARLGVKRVDFVQEAVFSRLVAAGPKTWDAAIAAITVTPKRAGSVDLTTPYLTADQGVLLRRGLTATPRSVADLAGLRLCSEQATTGASAISGRIRPTRAPTLARSATALFALLRSARCDAAVYDAPILAAERASAPQRYGPLAGRIATGERYALALQKGSPLTAPLDAAVRALVADGTVTRLERKWLATDVSTLPELR